MLSEEQIMQALHAQRVVSHGVANRHGPLGLEHLAMIIKKVQQPLSANGRCVRRYLDLPIETWEKLDRLAETASQTAARPVAPSQVAATISGAIAGQPRLLKVLSPNVREPVPHLPN